MTPMTINVCATSTEPLLPKWLISQTASGAPIIAPPP